MPAQKPLWRDHEHYRLVRPNAHLYIRHDAHRYIRHDAHRFMPPGAPRWDGKDVVRSVWSESESGQSNPHNSVIDPAIERANELQLLAERQELLRLKCDLLLLKLELKFRALLRSLKYRPDQPRVPAGNPDGGQWTTDFGGGAITDRRVISDESPDPIRPSAQYAAAKGHHHVPREVFENKKYSFRPETLEVLEDATTGSLSDPTSNRYDRLHREYSKAVQEALDGFLERNRIRSQQMTPDQARSFIEEIKTSRDPRISRFIIRMKIFEALYWYRRGPRGRE